MTFALVSILGSLFPEPIFQLSYFIGFESPSNFIFIIALFFLLAICLSLSIIVSRQALRIKNLVQNQALTEDRLESLEVRVS